MKELNVLEERLATVHSISILQVDQDTHSIGITFNYQGEIYTGYIDAVTENVELMRHDRSDIGSIHNVGSTTLNKLVSFFDDLPSIQTICS
ncbi:hypothetical protein [Photobacterium damselae]|uniref:hypothetical protein n=1 Tax=Photobacterium damselae TaxID=38293 RepID=UPI0010FE4FFE|nr:hypothetical protein [Photobacterium damselae]KAB1511990.1 hypothetical protein FD717_010425 [Photobacterium damselae subsp. damselae]TLS69580.1 hypothetical protein FD718_11605 [Photobacterium damselae subsp. damselae]TLS74574.1 hypothetical protein FD721_18415 [Photobacterium damselae subsp. damselae]TLS84137.1 hypothetical protein FD720_18280 [Photobacterium damselae subsp. damselae]